MPILQLVFFIQFGATSTVLGQIPINGCSEEEQHVLDQIRATNKINWSSDGHVLLSTGTRASEIQLVRTQRARPSRPPSRGKETIMLMSEPTLW